MNPEQDRRFDLLVTMLQQILEIVRRIAEDVDAIDRHQRPFGDGTKIRKGRR